MAISLAQHLSFAVSILQLSHHLSALVPAEGFAPDDWPSMWLEARSQNR